MRGGRNLVLSYFWGLTHMYVLFSYLADLCVLLKNEDMGTKDMSFG